MSFLAGIAVNALYGALGIDITGWLAASAHEEGSLVAMLSAVALIVLVARAMMLPAKAHAH